MQLVKAMCRRCIYMIQNSGRIMFYGGWIEFISVLHLFDSIFVNKVTLWWLKYPLQNNNVAAQLSPTYIDAQKWKTQLAVAAGYPSLSELPSMPALKTSTVFIINYILIVNNGRVSISFAAARLYQMAVADISWWMGDITLNTVQASSEIRFLHSQQPNPLIASLLFTTSHKNQY